MRLPFGIKSSSEFFQRTISQILENIDRCGVIADDILIWGQDKEEHNRRLCAVLERIRQANMKLNRDKCKQVLIKTENLIFLNLITLINQNLKEGDVKICSISCKSITFSSAIPL